MADFTPSLSPTQIPLTAEFVAAQADAPAQSPSGGDFHAAFALGDGSGDVALVLGDVAGHGPEQTAQANHMRELLSNCLRLGLTPAQTLQAVNAMIEPDPHFVGFGTVFVGTLEGGTGALTYASGGHEPGLLAASDARASGQVEPLEGTGPPVGAFPADMARFEQHRTIVGEGATLLLYTDGIPDAHPPHDRLNWFGLDRLKQTLARFAPLPPRRLVSRLLARVSRFCRGHFDDDVAVLVLRRRAGKGNQSGMGD